MEKIDIKVAMNSKGECLEKRYSFKFEIHLKFINCSDIHLYVITVNTSDAVVFSPKDVTIFKNASDKCKSNNGTLPEIGMSYPLYKIPDAAKDPDKGSQWYRSVSTKILKDSNISLIITL